MPHLTRHALDRIRVLTMVEALMVYVKNSNNAYRYPQPFHGDPLKVVLGFDYVTNPPFYSRALSASAPATDSAFNILLSRTIKLASRT